MSQLVVSTECPTCSGPLDFSEGANALRCPSCGSHLLVTGRKQVLSYWVKPTVKADVAGASARTGRLEARVARTQLFFVPFYRLTGHDFQWQDVPPKPQPENSAFPSMVLGGRDHDTDRAEIEIPIGSMLGWGADLLLGRRAGDVVRDLLGGAPTPERSLEQAVLMAAPQPAATASGEATVQFLDRYVEKSFPAADLPGLGVFSLGIRTQALHVALFQREALAALGTVVPVQVDLTAAMTQGLSATGFEHVVYRQVLGRILSIIYFPLWVVELTQGTERWLTVVDAVAESVVQPRAPLALYDVLSRPATEESRTVGLRPLVCPNCGGNLPVDPEDVIFFCATCSRAWQIHGADLTETPHEIAQVTSKAPPAGRPLDLIYLPFWRLEPAAPGPDGPAWVPAFRYRRLKALQDLAARFSAKPPVYELWTGERPTVQGCFYDVEDAVLLARFTAAGRRRAPDAVKAAAKDEPEFQGARLAWIPFRHEGQSLLDPFAGLALQGGLLG
jgi:DNA-directed RNA polymerase subunit RPC12/RpoP